MMNKSLAVVLAVLIALVIGCAGPKYSLAPQREENRIVFAHDKTGRAIVVEIDPAFMYEETIKRTRKDIEVEGFLFSNPSGKVFVTRLLTHHFSKITGIEIEPAKEPVRQFPPGTFFNPAYCDLVRAHAAAVGEEIVITAYKESLLSDNITCEAIDTLEALAERYPDKVRAFNDAGDRSIRMSIK